MKSVYINILKVGLALVSGWLGAAILLLSLSLISQTALADPTPLNYEARINSTADLTKMYSDEEELTAGDFPWI